MCWSQDHYVENGDLLYLPPQVLHPRQRSVRKYEENLVFGSSMVA